MSDTEQERELNRCPECGALFFTAHGHERGCSHYPRSNRGDAE